jgi:DNA-binding Lrp family transcriptional regulator
VNAEVSRTRDVYAELKKIDVDVHPLFGEFDFLVIADSPDLRESAAKVLDRIQRIEGVTKTRTLVGAEL